MSCNCQHTGSEEFVCTCDQFEHPLPFTIPAGLNDLPRQIAGFPEFRRAMLKAIGEKTGLTGWRGRERDDLGLMLIEMWAYICDSLSFYDKIIADETYVRTSKLRPSVRRLIGLLGYLPAPATGSFAKLAAQIDGRSPVAIPAGTAFRTGSFNGNPPQVFEIDQKFVAHPFNNKWAIAAFRPTVILEDNPSWLLVEPRTEIRPFSKLLLLDYKDPAQHQLLRVEKVEPYTGNDGRRYTKLFLQSPAKLAKGTPISRLWLTQPDPKTITGKWANMLELKNEHTFKSLLKQADDEGLSDEFDFDHIRTGTGIMRTVSAGEAAMRFEKPKADLIEFALRYSVPTVATIVNEFKQTISPADQLRFDKKADDPGIKFRPGNFALVDKNQVGIIVNARLDYNESELHLHAGQAWSPDLTTPVEALGNLFSVSRGESVRNEILGSGNAILASQQFKLAKKPLTYLLAPSALNDRGVENTLRVYVDGIKWKEVPGFFGITPDEEVYIVRQDDEGESYVIFGDGIRGKRVPTGLSNVVAFYRYGAGKANPPAASITQIKTALPGLATVTNPLPAAGGADAESTNNLRSNAPRSALILGRAVSMLDMEAVAMATPGVRAVQAEWHWHGKQQSPVAYIWYIGEAGIEPILENRLGHLSDPSTSIVVERAKGSPSFISIDVKIDDRYMDDKVLEELRQVLSNKTDGLLSPERLGIGKPLFLSKVFERVLSVAGIQSVQNILWNNSAWNVYGKKAATGFYFDFENGGIILNATK